MSVIHVTADSFDQLGQLVQQALDEIINVEQRLVDIKYTYQPFYGLCCASIIFRKVSKS